MNTKDSTTDSYKDKLTAYYNQVEEAIITIFGSFEKTAIWFDNHVVELNSLWTFCEKNFQQGWGASRAANKWYNIYVGTHTDITIRRNELIEQHKQLEIKIESPIHAARAARKQEWENATLGASNAYNA